MNKLQLISEQRWHSGHWTLLTVSFPTRIKTTVSRRLSLGVKLSHCLSAQALDLTGEGWGHSGMTRLMEGCQAASPLPSTPAKAEVASLGWKTKDRAGHTEEGYQENLSPNDTFCSSPPYFLSQSEFAETHSVPSSVLGTGTHSEPGQPGLPSRSSQPADKKKPNSGSLRTFFPRKVLPSFSKAV